MTTNWSAGLEVRTLSQRPDASVAAQTSTGNVFVDANPSAQGTVDARPTAPQTQPPAQSERTAQGQPPVMEAQQPESSPEAQDLVDQATAELRSELNGASAEAAAAIESETQAAHKGLWDHAKEVARWLLNVDQGKTLPGTAVGVLRDLAVLGIFVGVDLVDAPLIGHGVEALFGGLNSALGAREAKFKDLIDAYLKGNANAINGIKHEFQEVVLDVVKQKLGMDPKVPIGESFGVIIGRTVRDLFGRVMGSTAQAAA
ncbi:hypothetical protein JW962_03500 [Candidatus Dojkabacteria bacterium]|nr:hypothetical protein [Candidatus Dojkabacteria bacterium]